MTAMSETKKAALSGKYAAYPEYKDSGVEWLGDIPSDWKVVRLKFATGLVGTKTSPINAKYVGMENISSNNGKYIETVETMPEGISNSFSAGDVLFGKLRPYLAKSWLATFSGICSSEFLVLASRLTHPKYLNYFMLTDEFIEQVNSSTYGSKMPRASWDFIGLLPIPVMNYELSQKIATFLDHETAKIDTLIEKQQQLIELLKEKRQAVISHAVTKGLNPDAPMKDSGVEWLGEVPEHWGVSRLGFHATKIGSGKTPRGGAEIYQDSGVLFLRSQNVYDDGLRIAKSESVYINESIHHEMAGTSVQDGDVLLNITGGSIGRSCLVPTNFPDANVNQHVCILRFPTSIREFISFVMKSNSIKEQIDAFQTGGNREGLNFEQIAKLKFTLPPLNEINSIIEHIKSITVTFNTLEEQALQAIQLMQERRTALISAAVTGKIDVRNWVVPTTSSNSNEARQEVIA
ncbi:restriction endonuclease subunit S [Photobacterium toruni]|uniref:restriction endonuclease subunit S n=1 Tax=Photobacterium toruni TaxID=1935446 RepID=UPI002E18FF92|nr:restriction endonuclease subunit S [Photobacterium toruni]